MKQGRQGDVLLVAVAALPNGERIVRSRDSLGRAVLKEGEATHHVHVVEGRAEIVEIGALTFVVADEPFEVRHELPTRELTGDHDTIAFPPGIWIVPVQTEEYGAPREVYD
jgi:hypothetical protein